MSRACKSEQRSTPAAGETSRPASVGTRSVTVHALAAIFAAMVAAMVAIPAGASDRWFTIEIIVFDDLQDESLHAEHWPADPGEPSLQGAVELTRSLGGEPEDAAHAFRLVNRSDLSLNDVWNALRRSARYRPFMHSGWRVPGLQHGAARPAHVSSHLGDSGAAAAEHGGGERPAVQGTVKVSLARYLQVDVDLVYIRPAIAEAGAPNTAPTRFPLALKRRMRSKELHYIDHPLFGVLILITPL